MDCFPFIPSLPISPHGCFKESMCLEGMRAQPYLVVVSCCFFFFHSPLGKRMRESNKTHTNSPCAFALCLYAVPQPGVLPSSSPLAPERQTEATTSTTAFMHPCSPPALHHALLLFFFFPLIRALANTKGGKEAESERRSPMNVRRLSRGVDDDGRTEVKDGEEEEEDSRRGNRSGLLLQRTRLGALCH